MAGRNSTLAALRRHRVPAWWLDAKLGIFVHWSPASVPGFAPVDTHIGELVQSDEPDALKDTPYAEWYGNSLRFADSQVARHHRETYGDRPYEQFARDWEDGLASWDPDDWARRFAATGSRPCGMWPLPSKLTSSPPVSSASRTPWECGVTRSSVPCTTTTGQVSSVQSSWVGRPARRASCAVTSVSPSVVVLHRRRSSTSFVECGSLTIWSQKNSVNPR